jgi:hypothetical protein
MLHKAEDRVTNTNTTSALFWGIMPTFLVNISVSSLEDGTDRLARNVGKELLLYAA